jgi:hypothetical protein
MKIPGIKGLLGATALVFAFAQPASAVPTQLGFMVDASGSIGSTNFNNILRTGIANAFSNVLPTDSSVEVTLVRFSTSAQTIISPTVIDSAATRSAVASAVASMAYTGGSTCYSCAFNTLTGAVSGSNIYDPDNEIIYNMATDGDPFPESDATAIAARNAAITAGVDEIDAEFIGSVGSSGYNFLLNEIVYPQPGNVAPPDYSPGFVTAVSFENFENAFTNKLQQVVDVPVPGTVLLMGAGLLGLGFSRRLAT